MGDAIDDDRLLRMDLHLVDGPARRAPWSEAHPLVIARVSRVLSARDAHPSVAHDVAACREGPETTVATRKILEAQDAAIRAVS